MSFKLIKFLISLFSLWFAYAGNSNEHINRCNVWTKLHNKASKPSCPQGKTYFAVWNTHNETYIERCFVSQMVPRGYMLIIDQKSGSLNSVDCPEETIQPQPYLSYTQCGCNEIKSRCDEKGQAIVSNGSTYEDRLCRCDYTGGYRFVSIPARNCSCNPKTEICTCQRHDCEHGSKLSPDYTCVQEKEIGMKTFTCASFSERIHREKTSLPPIETNETGQVVVWQTVLIIIIPTALISSIVSFAIGVAVEKKKHVCEKVSRLLDFKTNNNKDFQPHPNVTNEGNRYDQHDSQASTVVAVDTDTCTPIQETTDEIHGDMEPVNVTEETIPIKCTEEKDDHRKSTESVAINVQFSRVKMSRGNKHGEKYMKPSSVMATSSYIQGTPDENSVTKASIHDLKENSLTPTKGTVPLECTKDINVNRNKQNTEPISVLLPRDLDDIKDSGVPLLKKDEHGFNEHEEN